MNNYIPRYARHARPSSGAGLAGGAVVTAAVTAAVAGIGATHSGGHTPLHLLPIPIHLRASFADQLLEEAASNFTLATQALSGADVAAYPAFETFVNGQIGMQDNALNSLNILQGAEDYLLSAYSPNDPTGLLVNAIFALLNVPWVLNSEAMLSLDGGVHAALASGLPALAALDNFGLFGTDLQMMGNALGSFVIDLAALQPIKHPAAADAAASGLASLDAPALAASAASGPACDCPTITPQLADPFLEFINKIDGNAFTFDLLGLYQNNDVIGTIAMQLNIGLFANQTFNSLGLDLIFSQILAGDWKSPNPLIAPTTNFFEQAVDKLINPDAFPTLGGLPTDPGNFIEEAAYQLDNLFYDTVYATDLDAAQLVLWPLG